MLFERETEEEGKARQKRLEAIKKKHGGKIIYDDEFGPGVSVSPFHYICEDGTHIHEWP